MHAIISIFYSNYRDMRIKLLYTIIHERELTWNCKKWETPFEINIILFFQDLKKV